jgi:putative DNA methylase
MPTYENRSIWVIGYGFSKWYQLFNPRQLLTLVKLVKLIREAGKRVEEEKLKQGWSREDAYKYAEAVTTYLAEALVKYADYSSLIAGWNQSLIMGHSLSMRGLAMVWNFDDMNPVADWTGTYHRNINTILDGLSYLINGVSNSSSHVRVLLDDATSLSKLEDERFDLIVTDPPYRDDVPYAELSDFYYVWLKRAFSDSDGVSLKPRFHSDVFFPGGVEVLTQWEWFASREVSLSEGRLKFFKACGEEGDCGRVYEDLLKNSFKAMAERLSDDGILVTYFAQSSPEAWSALLEAGLTNGLHPVVAFPVVTESEESVVARGKAAITASIVVAWRKGAAGEPLDVSTGYERLVEEATKALREVEEALAKAGNGVVSELHGVTVYVMAYARVLGLIARGGRPVKAGRPLTSDEIARVASEILARAYAREAGAALTHRDSIFYLLVKKVFPRGEEGRRLASSSDLILLSYGLGAEKEKALDDFVRRGVLKAYGREEETEVSSRKTYMLVEASRSDDELEVGRVLRLHGVNPDNPATFKSPVHALHSLMLYSLKPRDVFAKYYEKIYAANPSLTSEAVELAKALSTLEGDPEAELARRVLNYLNISGSTPRRGVNLLDFTKR